jgi:lysophospholipase L1-like esterase
MSALDGIDFGGARPATTKPAQTAVARAPEAPAAAVQAEPRSEAQLVYDRFLAQCNRFNRIRKRIDEVTGWIAPAGATRKGFSEGAPGISTQPTSFFDGLYLLADGNDQIADELERSIEDLARLF